jgi:hypothetical protein
MRLAGGPSQRFSLLARPSMRVPRPSSAWAGDHEARLTYLGGCPIRTLFAAGPAIHGVPRPSSACAGDHEARLTYLGGCPIRTLFAAGPAIHGVPRPSSAWAGDHEARSFAHHCLLFSLKTRCSGTARIMPTAVCRNQCIGLFRPPGSALVRQSSRMMFEHLFDHRPRGFHRVLAGK